MSNRTNVTAASKDIVFVPLCKLKKSPKNVRQIPHTKADIHALAASIRALGMLQYPVGGRAQRVSGTDHRRTGGVERSGVCRRPRLRPRLRPTAPSGVVSVLSSLVSLVAASARRGWSGFIILFSFAGTGTDNDGGW